MAQSPSIHHDDEGTPSFAIPVVVFIKNTQTEEVRSNLDSLPLDKDTTEPWIFMWTDGSYSCDCNRHRFFQRSRHEEEIDFPCTNSVYKVNIFNAVDWEPLLLEFDTY